MIYYIIRRCLYALPLLMGVNILTFVLFFIVNSPDDMARMQLGQKHVTEESITNWKQQHGYDMPLVWNADAEKQKKNNPDYFLSKISWIISFSFWCVG